MQDKYGFVYIWFDRKHKRFYIGCHWGTENDGYVCSSKWMNRSYKRRPSDFKRRIISRIYSSKHDLFLKEQQWLALVQNTELRTKYYNLQKEVGHWSMYEHSKSAVIKKLSEAAKGRPAWNKGKKMSAESRQKMSNSAKGRSPWNKGKAFDVDHKSKGMFPSGYVSPFIGTPEHREGNKRRLIENNPMRDERHRQAFSENYSKHTWLIICPDNTTITTKNLQTFCNEYGLKYKAVYMAARKGRLHKGHRISKLEKA